MASGIRFFYKEVRYRITHAQQKKQWLARAILGEQKKITTIHATLCTDEQLLQLHRQFLNKDDYTDIITFDYGEPPLVAGEIFISLDRARDNSAAYGLSLSAEINRLLIHGVLHLCGYVDNTPQAKRAMTQREDHWLSAL